VPGIIGIICFGTGCKQAPGKHSIGFMNSSGRRYIAIGSGPFYRKDKYQEESSQDAKNDEGRAHELE
jgi:hypothetical protein